MINLTYLFVIIQSIKSLFILKIGGSCLTYKKEGLSKIREGFLDRLMEEIKISQSCSSFNLIIVHGGGSITHPLLDRYNITDKCKFGVISSNNEKIAAAKIHLAMNLLNKKVVEFLLKHNIPAWPIQTSALFTSKNRRLKNFRFQPIKLAIEKGFIPVLHGDFVLDEKTTINICSGDLVSCLLAKKLGADRLLFASDVCGIYNDDPSYNKEALPFSTLKPSEFPNIFKSARQLDHSGGMAAKIAYIQKYCPKIEVTIFNGLIRNNFRKALLGQKVGTIIKI